jgi:hypothetical protein
MSFKVLFIFIIGFIYLVLAVWSLVMLFQLKKTEFWYKVFLFLLIIILPPLGFGLTLWAKKKSDKNDDPPKKDKPGKKKE